MFDAEEKKYLQDLLQNAVDLMVDAHTNLQEVYCEVGNHFEEEGYRELDLLDQITDCIRLSRHGYVLTNFLLENEFK